MDFLSILLVLLIVFCITKIIMLRKQSQTNRQILNILSHFSDKKKFESELNAEFKPENKLEYTAKLQALRVWGGAYHDDEEMFDAGLENLDLSKLVNEKNEKKRTGMNESTFFWIYLFTPNNLYSKGRFEQMDRLYEKLDTISDLMKDEMVKQLSDANRKFYRQEEDLGLSYYEKILNGDYEEVHYFKELISLYKQIMSAMSAAIYQKQGKTLEFEACIPALKEFCSTPLGSRWVKEIGLDFNPEESEDNEENPEVEEQEQNEHSEAVEEITAEDEGEKTE